MLQYKILFEDFSLLAVDKPQGLPTSSGENMNLCKIIFNDFESLKNVKGYIENEGGLLNRLDNDTGGIVLFAKSNEAFEYYSSLMKSEKIQKKYTAVVLGKPADDSGLIDVQIGHHYKNKSKMTVILGKNKFRGRPQNAVTSYKILKSNGKISVLEVMITKGVRHQIRVHLAYIGTPIIGDKIYNKYNKFNIYPYHFLYSSNVALLNMQNKKIEINSEVPFMDIINKIIEQE